jgi:predicted secreted protein
MHCLNCGAEMPDKVTVCVKCGSRTDVSAFAVDVGQTAVAPVRAQVEVRPRSSSATRAMLTVLFIAAVVLLVWWVASSR